MQKRTVVTVVVAAVAAVVGFLLVLGLALGLGLGLGLSGSGGGGGRPGGGTDPTPQSATGPPPTANLIHYFGAGPGECITPAWQDFGSVGTDLGSSSSNPFICQLTDASIVAPVYEALPGAMYEAIDDSFCGPVSTLSLWIKVPIGASTGNVALVRWNNPTYGHLIYYESTQNRYWIKIALADGSSSDHPITTAAVNPAGQWVHLTVVNNWDETTPANSWVHVYQDCTTQTLSLTGVGIRSGGTVTRGLRLAPMTGIAFAEIRVYSVNDMSTTDRENLCTDPNVRPASASPTPTPSRSFGASYSPTPTPSNFPQYPDEFPLQARWQWVNGGTDTTDRAPAIAGTTAGTHTLTITKVNAQNPKAGCSVLSGTCGTVGPRTPVAFGYPRVDAVYMRTPATPTITAPSISLAFWFRFEVHSTQERALFSTQASGAGWEVLILPVGGNTELAFRSLQGATTYTYSLLSMGPRSQQWQHALLHVDATGQKLVFYSGCSHTSPVTTPLTVPILVPPASGYFTLGASSGGFRHCDGCQVGDVRVYQGLVPPATGHLPCSFNGAAMAMWDFRYSQIGDTIEDYYYFNRFPLVASGSPVYTSWGTPKCTGANGIFVASRGAVAPAPAVAPTQFPTNLELLASGVGGTTTTVSFWAKVERVDNCPTSLDNSEASTPMVDDCWQMALGNRFQNAAINASQGAGHVQGWNFYVSTTKTMQSNQSPYSEVGIPLFEYSLWWGSTDPAYTGGWKTMWLGSAADDVGEWHHWLLELGESIAVYKDGTLATATNIAEPNNYGNPTPAGISVAPRAYCELYDGVASSAVCASALQDRFTVGGSSNPEFFPGAAKWGGSIAKVYLFRGSLTAAQRAQLLAECSIG